MTTTIVNLDPAARQLARLLDRVTDDQLTASTPCEKYTVGDLLDHIMGLTIAFRNAATKQSAESGESRPGMGSAANLHPEWRTKIPLQLNDLVSVWQEPAAWEGVTEAGGVTLPADVMGRVALNELILHSWDLARGTGQSFECDLRSAEVSFEFTSAMFASEENRPEGLFGPMVEVPPDAPLFDRVLGLAGRDPAWKAPTVR